MGYFEYVFRSARRRLPGFRAAFMALIVTASSLTLGATSAFADPSANDWARLRMCESSGNYAINTGNGYYGAYQFNIGTWEWIGGTGLPSDASPAEQDYRALKLYRINGWAPWPACTKKLGLVNDADAKSKVIPPDPGFAPSDPATSTTAKKAKKEKKATATATPTMTTPPTTTTSPEPTSAPSPTKKKAKKKATSAASSATTITTPTTTPAPTTQESPQQPAAAKKKKRRAAPAATDTPANRQDTAPETEAAPSPDTIEAPTWPGLQFFPGDYSEDLKIWQRQAAELGYDLIPTGYFGPKTENAVSDLQQRAGLTLVGYIGPQTWTSAWLMNQ